MGSRGVNTASLFSLLLMATVAVTIASDDLSRRRKSPPSPPSPSPSPSVFDGVVRPQKDGSSAALLIPPFKSNHASTIEILPDGTLTAAWFSGEAEEADGCAIVFASLPAGKQQWTTAAKLSQREGFSNQNPVLFHDNQTGILHLFHSQAPAKAGESASWIWHLQSVNGGTNWTAPEPLFEEPGAFPRNRIITGLDGSVIFPYYNASGKETSFRGNYAIIGRSKADHALAQRTDWTVSPIPASSDLVQPTVVRLNPGKPSLKAWFRDRRAMKIYTADSHDDGHTWSTPKASPLPNPNVGIEAFRLLSGNIAIVFNDYSKATAGKYGRTPLSVALSQDGGESWAFKRDLQVMDDGANKLDKKVEYSYPTILQSGDGGIHIMYTYDRATIKYRRITENWIKESADQSSRLLGTEYCHGYELSEDNALSFLTGSHTQHAPGSYEVCCPKEKGGIYHCPFNGGSNKCSHCEKSMCHIGGGSKSACQKCTGCKRIEKDCDGTCCSVCAEVHGEDSRTLASCMKGCGCDKYKSCSACKECTKPWSKGCLACKSCACKTK